MIKWKWFWNKVLSKEEIKELNRNPYQILQTRNNETFIRGFHKNTKEIQR